MFTPAGIGMHRKRLLAVAIFSLMAFCYEVVAASQLATEQPPIAEPTPTPSVAPSDAPQKASYSSCRVDGPYIAMTFDDGPHPVLTPRLLDVLKARGIRATFFLIGENAAEYPDIVRRIAAEGHEIGNHTWNHPQLTKLNPAALREEINRTSSTIAEIIGKPLLVMRPPYGATSAYINHWMKHEFGMKVILWPWIRSIGNIATPIALSARFLPARGQVRSFYHTISTQPLWRPCLRFLIASSPKAINLSLFPS
jgi:peptidoglycan/xylan/chitin deacetylase (PgdA/CDA1 family)